MKKKNIIGQKFGRWTVEEEMEKSSYGQRMFKCKCSCGNVRVLSYANLVGGTSKSCGCYNVEKIIERSTTHGRSDSEKLYSVWVAMRGRCNNPSNPSYKNYGGKGVRVCEEWNNYENFRNFMLEHGYKIEANYGEFSIDRIDVNGDYCPENCRVIPLKEQGYNKTNNYKIEYKGIVKTATEWEREYGLSQGTLRKRIRYRGWDIERAITTPLRPMKKKNITN